MIPEPVEEASTRAARLARMLDLSLLVAVLAAIALAVTGVTENSGAVPADAVAQVNGQPIARADYEAVLARVGEQIGHAPGADERAEVLARLIDEELLLQRGLALGLPRGEGRLRGLLVQETMRQALAGVSSQPVSDADLAAFFARNAAYFQRPARLRVRRFVLPDAASAEAARVALVQGGVAALDVFEPARDTLLPDAPLPEAKLRDYLGADAVARLAAFDAGGSLERPGTDGRTELLVVVSREQAAGVALDAVHAEVESEFRRRRDEQAVSEYLRRLREDARILLGTSES